MKTTTKLIPVSAAICATLVGCEWGGVHSGESWNDAYSWANFTGTYKLVNNVVATSDSSSESSSLSPTGVNWSGGYVGNKQYETGKDNLLEKSVSVSIGSLSFSNSDGNDTMTDSEGNSVTVNRATGSLTVNLKNEAVLKKQGLTISMSAMKSGGSNLGGNYAADNAPFRWLNLKQKGNLLTIEMVGDDSKSAIFSGKITGASCPTANEEGYVQAGHIRFTFEATRTTNAKQTLTGSISGDWSGSSSERTGTIANRTIDATFHDGKTATPFQAVSGSTTVYAKEISAAAGVTP